MESNLQLSNGSTHENLSVVTHVDPLQLKPHPCNSSIYGEDEDVTELVNLIRETGWVKPLVVNNREIIISGHRRWKAILKLGWKTVPVEVREFPDEIAELQALLLENANRFKTVEHKVREASAWKNIEKEKAKKRQLAAQNNHAGRAVPENFPELLKEKGETRDRLAKLVGLGSGRNYSKAARVVDAIDEQTSSGNLETAQALRSVLNGQSVDAAAKLLKRISPNSDRTPLPPKSDSSEGSLNGSSPTSSNSAEGEAADIQRSCWNCKHCCTEVVEEDHSFYCNLLGVQSLLDQDGDTRGAECNLWSYRFSEATLAKTTNPSTFTLLFPEQLHALFQDAARQAGMSLVDWATKVLESAAKNSYCTSKHTDSNAKSGSNSEAAEAAVNDAANSKAELLVLQKQSHPASELSANGSSPFFNPTRELPLTEQSPERGQN
jgi:ParB/RepB/Spo0J family partition protein